MFSGEEDVEGDFEHLPGLGSAFGPAVEAGEHVAEGGVGRFDQMRLRLRLPVRFGRADPLEGEVVTGVGVGEDRADLADGGPGRGVDGGRASDAAIADMIGDDAPMPAAVRGPDYRPLPFFWT
ncbi:hypothetical protein ABLE43_03270 [Sphingomonas sp. VNH70]